MACVVLDAPAVEVTASGISIAFFDEAGKVTHKLNSRRGASTGSIHQLQRVEIVYLSGKDPEVIVQRVEAAEATWDEKREVLSGVGVVRVTTERNQLAGVGFDFALATSLLRIHREFEMTNAEVKLTSDRATVELVVERTGDQLRVRDIKRCEAVGNLVIMVQPTAKKKYLFEKAYSDVAIYEGSEQTITLPKPTRYERMGKPAGGANTMVIDLRERVAP